MGRKAAKIPAAEQQLPALGTAPYVELMEKTASQTTDRNAAHMGLLLMWLGDSVLDVMDVALSPYGMTESKLDLLLLLFLHKERELVSPSAIADRLGIRRASVTSLLDWLEKRNWIVREPNPKDGRMIHVRISQAGIEAVEQVLPTYWSTCASLIEDLTPEERGLLARVVGKLQTSMEKRLGVGR
ncbi:MarR family winged helix-turn-helix transcriptional regulator [Brevibacillus fluminis]|uniref:MarR family winged helix-turn-helix transcriptional regulator n=1 Tax=Brevibacillus fluminis TaxID=511487 RepID=UPI003F8C9BF5